MSQTVLTSALRRDSRKEECQEDPRNQEVASQSCDAPVEYLPECGLHNEVNERKSGNDTCDIPPTATRKVNEASPAATLTETLMQVDKFGAKALHEQKDIAADSQSLSDGVNTEVATCCLSEQRISSPLRSEQEQESENMQRKKHSIVHSSEEATVSASTKEVKEHVHNSGFKKLYPDLPLELAQERVPVLAIKSLLPTGRLYPEISMEPELVPFTKQQLKIFQPCSWLENVESYVEEFGSIAQQDRHEFYELLLSYWRCRKQLLLAEAELQTMNSDLHSIKGRLWTFKDKQQSVQVV